MADNRNWPAACRRSLASLAVSRRITISLMSEHRWHWLSIGLVLTGVGAVVLATAANASHLGWWQGLIYAGCAATAGAALLFRRKLSAVEIQLEALRHRLAEEETRLDSERSQDLITPCREALSGTTFETRKTSSRRPLIASPMIASAAPQP